jgi:hypothetical protein
MARHSAQIAARIHQTSSSRLKRPSIKKSSKAPRRSPQTVDFPRLPAEVRVKIYKLQFSGAILYVNDDGIDLACSTARGELARTSKDIYSEAMPVLFSLTELVYHGATKGPAQLSLIPQYQRYIPQLRLVMKNPAAFEFRNIKGYSALRDLGVDIGHVSLDLTAHSYSCKFDVENTKEFDPMLVSSVVSAMKQEHVYPLLDLPKMPIKHEDLVSLALNKKRRFEISVVARLVCIFENYIRGACYMVSYYISDYANADTNMVQDIVVDWVNMTIKSKSLWMACEGDE